MLDARLISRDLGVQVIGRDVRVVSSVSSTNDWARSEALDGAPDGAVFVTETQTSGRGQAGRSWLDTPGHSILASILLRPQVSAERYGLLSMLAATATSAAIRYSTGLAAELKWPNDVLIQGRKVAGILLEAEYLGNQLDFAVIGIGLNVSFNTAHHPEIAATATSLLEALGAAGGRDSAPSGIDRLAVLRELLRQLDARYASLRQDQGAELFAEWRGRLSTLGRWVTLVEPGGKESQVWAEEVAPDGALMVRNEAGQMRTILAGEVSVRG